MNKSFMDIPNSRWNKMIRAVNHGLGPESINPPLDAVELESFNKMVEDKRKHDAAHPKCPMIYEMAEYDYDDPELDIYKD